MVDTMRRKRVGRLREYLLTKVRGHPSLGALERAGMTVGSGVRLMHNVFLDPSHAHLITLGDGVVLGPSVTVLAHDASTRSAVGYTRIAPVNIGARVFVGAGSVILPGVSIGEDAIVGAGSVVTKDVPSGTIVVGNPARPARALTDYVDHHRSLLHVLPTYPVEGWTARGGITGQARAQMARDLEGRHGYVK
jgi:maltose O-acetyltransferase